MMASIKLVLGSLYFTFTLLPFRIFFNMLIFSERISSSSMGNHWKGVCGFGINGDTDRLMSICSFSKGISIVLMASISSTVSHGKPIMRYSLSFLQPYCLRRGSCPRRISTSIFLLILHLIASVADSRANVKPVRAISPTRLISSSRMLPIFSDGKATDMPRYRSLT